MLITYGNDSRGESEEISITRLSYSQEADEWKVSLEEYLNTGLGSFVNTFHLAADQLLMVREKHILLLSKTFDV